MKEKTRKPYAVTLLAGLAAISAITLQGGWPVIDIIGNSHLLVQIQKMKDQFIMMQQQYQEQVNMVRRLEANAKFVINKNRWRAAIESWRYPGYGNASGKTAPWYQATKDATKAAEAITSVASRLPSVVDRYGRFGFTGSDIDDKKRKHYAAMEIAAGTHVNTMELLADVRAVQQQRNTAIKDLEDGMLSDIELDNSEVALLNKLGAASMINLRNQQDQLKMQSQMIALMLQEELRRHNATVDASVREAGFLDSHKRTHDKAFKGMAATLAAYRGY